MLISLSAVRQQGMTYMFRVPSVPSINLLCLSEGCCILLSPSHHMLRYDNMSYSIMVSHHYALSYSIASLRYLCKTSSLAYVINKVVIDSTVLYIVKWYYSRLWIYIWILTLTLIICRKLSKLIQH